MMTSLSVIEFVMLGLVYGLGDVINMMTSLCVIPLRCHPSQVTPRTTLGLLLDMAGVGDDGGNETVNESSGRTQSDIV